MGEAADDGVIRGREIELVDTKGRVRILLAVVNDEPFLDFLDPNGFPRISVRLYGDSPSIAFMSQEGHPWFSISENKDRDSFSMVFFNRKNAPAFWAEMPSDSPAMLVLYDTEGKEIWRAPAEQVEPPSRTTP